MAHTTGHRMLTRVRSFKKLRMSPSAEEAQEQIYSHRRQHSESISASVPRSLSTKSDARTHWPPLEWDPLKLNPPVPDVPELPARAQDSISSQTLRTKRSFAGHELRRPRFHHSDSGFSLVGGEGFDFAFEREQALGRMIERNQPNDEDIHAKGCPSPASSLDSDKSWPDDINIHDDDGAVRRSNELWGLTPSPRRRPQAGKLDDPNHFLKRGGWKRRGIVFGGPTTAVYQTEDDAFEIP